MSLQKFAGEAVRQRGSSPKLQVFNTALMTAQSGYSFKEAKADHEYWGAVDAGDDSFTPLYEGAHVVSAQRLPSLPPKIAWGSAFMHDTDIVLWRHKWYVADVTCLVEASGQVRETIITESMPTLNLSAAIVDDLRTQKLIAGIGPDGPVASLFSFPIYFVLNQYSGDLGTLAGRLRRSAEEGNAGAQYTLSRLMRANVSLNRTGLNEDALLRRAADPGKDRRAMLALGAMTGKIPAEEQRGWVMKSARAGLAPAQVLVALDSWAEQTEVGYARARHWLELAAKAGDPVASKYLAALLVSHSYNPADWKVARSLRRPLVKAGTAATIRMRGRCWLRLPL